MSFGWVGKLVASTFIKLFSKGGGGVKFLVEGEFKVKILARKNADFKPPKICQGK